MLTGQTLQLPTHTKVHLDYQMVYLRLTLAHCKGQGQGHVYLD